MSKLDFYSQLDFSVAMVCDLNLNWYLVPKTWVKECLLRQVLKQCVQVSNTELAQRAHLLASKMLGNETEFMQVLINLQKLCRSGRYTIANYEVMKTIYSYCFGHDLEQLLKVPSF